MFHNNTTCVLYIALYTTVSLVKWTNVPIITNYFILQLKANKPPNEIKPLYFISSGYLASNGWPFQMHLSVDQSFTPQERRNWGEKNMKMERKVLFHTFTFVNFYLEACFAKAERFRDIKCFAMWSKLYEGVCVHSWCLDHTSEYSKSQHIKRPDIIYSKYDLKTYFRDLKINMQCCLYVLVSFMIPNNQSLWIFHPWPWLLVLFHIAELAKPTCPYSEVEGLGKRPFVS